MTLNLIPKDRRNLRACMLCSLVKAFEQFEYDGCDNCESFLQLRKNKDAVYECTSSSFNGVVAMMSPSDSWVSRWQRINRFAPGIYAISVIGHLPPGIIRDLKIQGVIYRSRDTCTH